MIYVLLVGLVAGIDQFTKYLVVSNIPLNKEIEIIPNFFRLTYCQNTGVAFSLFNDSTLFITILNIFLIGIIVYLIIKEKNKFSRCVYSLIIGGAIGNIIDRLLLGYVVDFLSFTFFGWDFAVFNVADSFITVSVILILINELLRVNKCQK